MPCKHFIIINTINKRSYYPAPNVVPGKQPTAYGVLKKLFAFMHLDHVT
jgi:hypothetical protein